MEGSSASNEGVAGSIAVGSTRDISAALGASLKPGGLLLTEADLGPDFFNLRTGLAGELFQKIVNYHGRLAIVVRDPAVHGERFTELAREHRSHPNIRVFSEGADARRWLDSGRWPG